MAEELKEELTAESIWEEYQKGVTYNTALELYENVEKCENFYIGKQWEGLNAPDLPKPVINVLRRVVSYFIAMIVSDDVGTLFTPFKETDETKKQSKVLSETVDEVIESCGIKVLAREVVRDAAVDGDGALYFYFDPNAESGQDAKGKIFAEVLDNTCVMFGNPYNKDLQSQDYIIVSIRRTLKKVKEEAEALGLAEEVINSIQADSDANMYNPAEGEADSLVTVVLKFYKEDGKVMAVKSTQNVILREPWDTGLTLYPISFMRWDSMKNSYRGVSALLAMIPNQIAINQLFAMAIHHMKTLAFPKIIYNSSMIKSWSNKVGQAIGTQGNPNDAIATGFKAPDMSAQVMQLIETLIQKTLEFMGASDATLGNVKPDNTSAIIAVQQSTAVPLELQRLEFYRFTEEYVRIIVDLIKAHYGTREISTLDENKEVVTEMFDFSGIELSNLNLHVEIGPSSYFSELMQIQTLDNLFTKGIVTDAIEYLEQIPSKYIPGKEKLIENLKQKQDQAAQTPQQGAAPMQGDPMQMMQGAPPMMPMA